MEQPGKFPDALRLNKRKKFYLYGTRPETEDSFTVQASLIPGKAICILQ